MEDTRVTLLDCNRNYLILDNDFYLLNTDKIVGHGGSCLVYAGWKQEAPGLSRRVLIKEFYPIDEDITRNPVSGDLHLPEEDDWIQARRNRFGLSYERFITLCNLEELNQFVVQARQLYHAHGTDYLVVDFGSGSTMETRMEDGLTLHSFCDYMITLSKVVGRLHQKDFVHLDLKPANILCAENAVIELLDVDSILSIEEMRRGCVLPSSLGYTAPEIYQYAERQYFTTTDHPLPKQRALENIHRADIYAMGAIVYRWLFQTAPTGSLEQCPIQKDQIIAALQQKEPDLTKKTIQALAHLLAELLQQTLTQRLDYRYASMEQLEAQLKNIQTHTIVQVLYNFTENAYPLFGREEKLSQLEAALARQNAAQTSRIVILCGVGGVGKSALARQFAANHQQRYDVIAEVYAASAEEAVRCIEILNWEPDSMLPPEEQLRQSKKKLSELNRRFRTLLLVHDYDVSADAHFSIWTELGCDILLTSRHQWEPEELGVPVLSLKCEDLSLEQAKEIFSFFYTQRAKTDAQKAQLEQVLCMEADALERLLQYINLLPLAIKFQVRHMTVLPGSEIRPSQALRDLEEAGLSQTAEQTFQNRNDTYVEYGNVYNHVKTTLRRDLTQLLKGPCREALRFMTLIPPAHGIHRERFEAWTGVGATHLELLEELGWLEFLPGQRDLLQEDSPLGVYVLPTFFQQVLCKEPQMQCTMQNCAPFLRCCSTEDYRGPYQARMAYYLQQETLARYLVPDTSREYIRYLQCTVTLTQITNNGWNTKYTDKCLTVWHTCLDLCQKYHPDDFDLLGACYRHLGICYHSMGLTEKALYYYDAMSRHLTVASKEPLTSETLNNIEGLYSFLLEQGLPEKSIDLLQKTLEKHHSTVAITPAREALWKRSIGSGYRLLGDWRNALEYYSQAYEEITFLYEPSNLRAIDALSTVYRELGLLHYEMSIFNDARNYLMEALRGYTHMFGESHLNTCVIMEDLARICVLEGDPQAALEYHKKCLNAYCKNNGSPEKIVLLLLELALDNRDILGHKEQIEGPLHKAFHVLSKNPYSLPVTTFSEAVAVLKKRYQEHFQNYQIRTGLEKREQLCFLCNRAYGKSPALAEEYRSLAQLFSDYGMPLKSQYYQQYAHQCEI